VPALEVSVPIGHELLGQCIKQGRALEQRASLVGDFSDYESWKSARKHWIEATMQALEHMYGGPGAARDFFEAVTCPQETQRWQEQYAADLKCVAEAIDLLTVLQGELAFGPAGGPPAAELPPGAPEPPADAPEPGSQDAPLTIAEAPDGQPRLPGEPSTITPPAPAELRLRDAGADADGAEASEQTVGAELEPAQAVGSQLAHQAGASAPAEHEPAAGAPAASTRTHQVLLAHGRDERWRQAVEHLLEQTGEHEIRIVNQRSGNGASRLAEALGEETPTSRYAVVLLTADDVGAPRLESEAEPFFSTRAHQEVVFQMGFLVAALSPGRVCVLYEDGVELPYDLDGVSHVRLDLAGTWQPKLLLHLRGAGFDYDMNKLVEV
jgi:predicted nucleotide-binding protein